MVASDKIHSCLIFVRKSVGIPFNTTLPTATIEGLKKLYEKYDKPEKMKFLKEIAVSEDWGNLEKLY